MVTRRALRGIICCLLLMPGVLLLVGARTSSGSSRVEQHIVIDGSGGGPVFDGLGALSAGASSRLLIDYPEPQRSEILDYLFKPGYGAALQHLKVEIGADVNSTDGSEPSFMRSPSDRNFDRGYEWWLMLEARKRNPRIVLDSLPWGAPGWIGSGRFYSTDMANYVAAFILGAKSAHNLDIGYTGVWNEKVYDANYVKELRSALDRNHLSTKIVCCDEYPSERGGEWQIAEAMKKDRELDSAVTVVGVHYPWIYNHVTTPDVARRISKPLWSSEDQPNSGGGPFLSRNWENGGRLLARLYNLNYLQGGFTATEIWSPITSYYDILAAPGSGLMIANTPWSGHYDVQGAIWATAHTTQFTEPGWKYDNPSCGYLDHGGTFVTFLSPDRKNWSSVVESIDAREPQTLRIEFTGGLNPAAVHVWQTNSSRTFEHVSDMNPAHGSIALTIEPDSLYTITNTTGQGKGTATAPQQAPFPLPYGDDFESGREGAGPKFLSDQDGAFEIHPCRGRKGNCLEQVITTVPIPWSPLPDPFTLAGDEDRKDYEISADAQIPLGGIATIFGRIDSADVFREHKAVYPSGYGLLLKSNGDWSLISSAYGQSIRELAHGQINQKPEQWHHLMLRFIGPSIDALIDGQQLTSIADSSHAHGMFSLGSNWTEVLFDNLRVDPVNGSRRAESPSRE